MLLAFIQRIGMVNRFSDNGEPSGTAGGPILNIITSMGLSNILVIVTRYFGGILLGTGGLVRAYSEATNCALEKAEIIPMDLGISAYVEVSYSDLNKIQYYFEQNYIEIVNQEFNENIKIFINLTEDKFDKMIANKENLKFIFLSFGKIEKKYIKNIDIF